MKKILSFLMMALFSVSMFAADVTVKSTFTKATVPADNKVTDLDGKVTWNIATTVGAGSPTYAVGKSTIECLKFGGSKTEYFSKVEFSTDYFKDYNVTSVALYVKNNGSKIGTLTAKQGDVTIGTKANEAATSDWNVMTATGTKGAGGTLVVSYEVEQASYISYIEVTYEGGGDTPDPVVANFCQTEVGHLMEATPAQDSYVLLSIGSKNGKTIVRIDQDEAKNTQMFDYLQVTGLTQTGEDVAEGGAKAMAVEFDTPTPVNDSLTLEILWSTVNWAGRWMVQNLRVAVADCQYAVLVPVPVTPITCAEVYSKAKDDKVALNDVTVTYVNGKNVYVKDESGAMLLYLPSAATWKAGDKLAGVEGVVDVYNGLYEVKPSAEQVAAVVATAGDAPAPVELAVAPVAADVNKYVILKNVSVAAGEFKTDKATNLNLTIGEETVVLRNNFKIAQVFDADAKYNIVGAVAIYNTTVQLYFISAEEIVVPQLNIFAYDLKAGEVTDGKVTIDYKLNAKATAVEIQLLDAEGAVKKTFDATGLKKGANQQIVDLAGVAAGTYNWAIKATAKPTAEMVNVLDYDQKLYNFYLPQGIAIDNSPESPFFGRIYVSESIDGQSDGATDRTKATKQGIFIYDPLHTDITNQGLVGYKGSLKTACSASGDRVSFKRVVVDKDGYVYVNSLDANVGGVYRLDPANPKADLVPVLDTTKRGTLYAPISSILVEGQGEDKVLYTAENFVASASKGSINKYAIGNATNFAGKADTVILNSSDYALGISDNQFVSDGRGGFWGCQHRWGYDVWSAVYHINANKVRDYVIMKDVNTDVLPQSTDVTTYRGVIAINEAKTLLAIPTKSRVVVYNIAYNAETGVPTLTEAYRTGAIFGTNIDGLAFDLAENLYVMSASKEKMFAFATVKAENNCTTPAAKASKIVVAGTGTAIDNSFVPAKVEKVIVNGQVLIIRDGKTYNMMGQTIR